MQRNYIGLYSSVQMHVDPIRIFTSLFIPDSVKKNGVERMLLQIQSSLHIPVPPLSSAQGRTDAWLQLTDGTLPVTQ